MLQKGDDEVDEGDDEWEPVEPITRLCDSILGTELSAKKTL